MRHIQLIGVLIALAFGAVVLFELRAYFEIISISVVGFGALCGVVFMCTKMSRQIAEAYDFWSVVIDQKRERKYMRVSVNEIVAMHAKNGLVMMHVPTGKPMIESTASNPNVALLAPIVEKEKITSYADYQDRLHLATTLLPHADEVLSSQISIFGIRGAGKSNTVAVFVEELARLNAPLILFDTEDEYEPLCSSQYMPNPFKAHSGNVTQENAHDFAYQILQDGLQVVLNLQSYITGDEAALVMIEIIRGLREWEEARVSDDRVSCMVILDEASVWLPQNVQESLLSKEKLTQLQQTFFTSVVRLGRKRGIGFLFATQRIAEIDKRAMSSSMTVLHKQTLDTDLKRYAELGIDKEAASILSKGEAFVLYGDSKSVHQFRQRESPHGANTPGLASIRRKNRTTENLVSRQIVSASITCDMFVTQADPNHDITAPEMSEIDRETSIIEGPLPRQIDAKPPSHLMTELQSAQFVAAYRIKPNIDFCLKNVGCSSLYREHARQLISEHNLK